jgi:hypothetical protein
LTYPFERGHDKIDEALVRHIYDLVFDKANSGFHQSYSKLQGISGLVFQYIQKDL